MPRKASGKIAVREFKKKIERIEAFAGTAKEAGMVEDDLDFVYDTVVIKTFVAFEQLLLECLVVAVNQDNSKLAETSGVSFPKHLRKEVAEYLIVGTGYFNFRGFDELKGLLKKYVQESHWLFKTVADQQHKNQLDLLVKLRNYAAHGSPKSKADAIKATGGKQIGSAGGWLKAQRRFPKMIENLRDLADEIEQQSPY